MDGIWCYFDSLYARKGIHTARSLFQQRKNDFEMKIDMSNKHWNGRVIKTINKLKKKKRKEPKTKGAIERSVKYVE